MLCSIAPILDISNSTTNTRRKMIPSRLPTVVGGIAMLGVVAVSSSVVNGFAFISPSTRSTRTSTNDSNTQLNLFDGIKEAFSAPTGQKLDAERETPIDRWMGWNVKSDNSIDGTSSSEVTGGKVSQDDNFVDAMDETNYICVTLKKPMGIVFEENDSNFGGIFVLSVTDGGAAANEGSIMPGDQLVAVNNLKVSGKTFDEALGTIVDATTIEIQLLFFRGTEQQFYGPTGASQEWLNEYITSKTTTEQKKSTVEQN